MDKPIKQACTQHFHIYIYIYRERERERERERGKKKEGWGWGGVLTFAIETTHWFLT